MSDEPLAALLKAVPGARYHSEWRLLTWHPRGLLDDALADKIVAVITSEERIEQVPFHRYADFSGLTHIRLKVGHVFDIAKERRFKSGLSVIVPRLRSGSVCRRKFSSLLQESSTSPAGAAAVPEMKKCGTPGYSFL